MVNASIKIKLQKNNKKDLKYSTEYDIIILSMKQK